MKKMPIIAAVAGVAAAAQPAFAEDIYATVSGAGVFLQNSQNEGAFAAPFVTGAGTNVPFGTTLPAGADVGWETEFDVGYAVSAALGKRFGPIRGEFEFAYQNNGVDTHTGVSAGGVALGGEDAAVLLTGQADNLGVPVADLVADGQGRLDTIYLMANAIYDFDLGGRIKPYVGAGVGVGFVNVDYSPSNVSIINDDQAAFAFQGMVGAAYEVSPRVDLFAGYRYRGTTNVEVNSALLAAEFDIENRGSLAEAGLRFNF